MIFVFSRIISDITTLNNFDHLKLCVALARIDIQVCGKINEIIRRSWIKKAQVISPNNNM